MSEMDPILRRNPTAYRRLFCWLKPFRGVATKHLLRYLSWYIRIAAMAPTRAHAAARLLFFEALAAYSLPRPG